MPFLNFQIFTQALTMFFMENKVFSIRECFFGTKLLVLNFLLSWWLIYAARLFFNNQNMPDALYFLTLLKIGSAGLSFGSWQNKPLRFLNGPM